jgi:hypothetical protein
LRFLPAAFLGVAFFGVQSARADGIPPATFMNGTENVSVVFSGVDDPPCTGVLPEGCFTTLRAGLTQQWRTVTWVPDPEHEDIHPVTDAVDFKSFVEKTTTVPEPAAIALLGVGLLLAVGRRKSRKTRR